MYSLGPKSLERTAGLHSSQFVALWPAAAESCRWAYKAAVHPRTVITGLLTLLCGSSFAQQAFSPKLCQFLVRRFPFEVFYEDVGDRITV